MQHPQQGYGYAPTTAYFGGYQAGNSSNDNSMTAMNYVPQGYTQPQAAAAMPNMKSNPPYVAKPRHQQSAGHPEHVGVAPYEVYGQPIAQPTFGITGYTPQQQTEMSGVPPGFAAPYYYPAAAGGGRGGRPQGSRHSLNAPGNMYFDGLMAAPIAYPQGTAPQAAYYYPTQSFSGNNAVPEKTPTIYVKHPETSKVMGVKLNRVLDTLAGVTEQVEAQAAAKSQSGPGEAKEADEGTAAKTESTAAPEPLAALTTTKLRLCPSFMSSQGCAAGSCCPDVHTAGMEYLWETIAPKTVTKKESSTGAEVTTYGPGFLVRCFDPTLTHYYEIPSESVLVNKGSAEYVRMFNFNGNNFKKKFKVFTAAANVSAEDIPESGEIYCTLESLESHADKLANTTHVNDPDMMHSVERLPESMMVRVYDQNNYERFQDYPGSRVLVTEGGKSYAKMYAQCHNSIPIRKRMQHCAHFRLHNMCRLGAQCRFVHVLRTHEEVEAAKQKEQEKSRLADEAQTTGATNA